MELEPARRRNREVEQRAREKTSCLLELGKEERGSVRSGRAGGVVRARRDVAVQSIRVVEPLTEF